MVRVVAVDNEASGMAVSRQKKNQYRLGATLLGSAPEYSYKLLKFYPGPGSGKRDHQTKTDKGLVGEAYNFAFAIVAHVFWPE